MAEYSADRFYVDATDGHGHGNTVRVRVPPSFYNEIGNLVAAKIVPEYRNLGDIFRDGAIHRLHYLKEAGFALTPDQMNLLAIIRSHDALRAEQTKIDYLHQIAEDYRSRLNGSSPTERSAIRAQVQRDLDTLTMPSQSRIELENLL